MNIQEAAAIARRLNPTVIDRGEWPGLGRMYNVVMSNGDQTSIVVEPGGDLDKKVAETIGRFEAPPKVTGGARSLSHVATRIAPHTRKPPTKLRSETFRRHHVKASQGRVSAKH